MSENKNLSTEKFKNEISNEVGLTSNGRREKTAKDKSLDDSMVEAFKDSVDDKR